MNPSTTNAYSAAAVRCQPSPIDTAWYRDGFGAAGTEVGYGIGAAIALHGAIGTVREIHVNHCTDADCPTCWALAGAMAAHEGFRQAEKLRDDARASSPAEGDAP